jgi:hypothetical protein
MICYKDTTYCASPNCRNECGRQFTKEDRKNAIKWWGSEDFPIAMAEFCDDKGNLLTKQEEKINGNAA